MLFDYLYKSESVGDLGTLYQLKARMNRKDVSDKVNKSYKDVKLSSALL